MTKPPSRSVRGRVHRQALAESAAHFPKQADGNHARIFVQIASYRDPECQWTLQDMFAKAAHPERVFAGVVWQYIPAEDKHCFVIETRPEQVRVERVNARFSRGVCWARARTQQLWRGEEYTLQIDSHTRFEPGWDETLIAMCQQTGLPKPVITCYPAGYTPPDRRETGFIFGMGAKEFDTHGILTMEGRATRLADAPDAPMPGAFCGACFLFAPAAVIREVPYDPHLYFFGEEISLAARLWTHGWDLFHPHAPVLYTRWSRRERRTHFDDHAGWRAADERSRRRVLHLLGTVPTEDTEALRDLDQYGLGNERTLEDYQRYSGVNFMKKTISPRARAGGPFRRPARSGARRPAPAAPALLPAAHEPRVALESPHALVFDDFLPEETWRKLLRHAEAMDYERINTTGRVQRAWRLRDGFPLRSQFNPHYFPDPAAQPDPKQPWVYPTATALDEFIEPLHRLAPRAAPLIGRAARDWDRFSVTSWIYPRDAALSLHDDGSGVYSGAYAYFLNPHWDIHWGGLLMLLDPRTSRALQEFKTPQNVHDYYQRKWIDPTEENAFLWEPGLAQCVFPKRNRLVFIHPDAYHFVTKVNADAGDNARMSFAGFFMRPPKK